LTHEITLSGAPEFLRDEPAEGTDEDDQDSYGHVAEEDDDEASDDVTQASHSPAAQPAGELLPSTAPVETVTRDKASLGDKNRAEWVAPQAAESASATDSNDADEADSAPEPPKRTIKPKRSSVPSWDEIVFGTKHD
jgi:hypothetical protein